MTPILTIKNLILCLASAALLALLSSSAAAQGVSLRTNLAWDAVAEPNVGVEFPISNHWSLGANAGLKAWPRWLAWDWDLENPTHWRNTTPSHTACAARKSLSAAVL